MWRWAVCGDHVLTGVNAVDHEALCHHHSRATPLGTAVDVPPGGASATVAASVDDGGKGIVASTAAPARVSIAAYQNPAAIDT